MIRVACIVEGQGDVASVPILLRRIAESLPVHTEVLPPIRIPRQKLVKPGELERAVELAARKVGGQGGVLILIDSDDDCPAELGPELLARARQARSDIPIGVVLAKMEYEAWFLAAAESLRGKRGLVDGLTSPEDPEAIRGAKKWLSQHMTRGRTYRATLDQPALSAVFDLDAARQRAPSFDKCCREIADLFNALRERESNK